MFVKISINSDIMKKLINGNVTVKAALMMDMETVIVQTINIGTHRKRFMRTKSGLIVINYFEGFHTSCESIKWSQSEMSEHACPKYVRVRVRVRSP